MTAAKRSYRVAVAYNTTEERAEGDDPDLISESAVEQEADAVCHALEKLNHTSILLPIGDIFSDINKLLVLQPDIIFNLCEGYRGKASDEMFVAGCWELSGIPYTGNPPVSLGLAQDKVLTKKLLISENIPTPEYEVYEDTPDDTHLSYPLIAKPSREDGSVGITQHSVITNRAELREVVNSLLFKYRQPILVEKYISGREFNVAVLGNRNIRTLPVSEISFKDVDKGYHAITSYEAKWLEEHPLFRQTPSICPADIDEALKRNLEIKALRVFRILGGRDYGRVDFRVDDNNQVYVLEYNPNPDIAADAGFSKALKAAGFPYEKFIEQILEEALLRKSNRLVSVA